MSDLATYGEGVVIMVWLGLGAVVVAIGVGVFLGTSRRRGMDSPDTAARTPVVNRLNGPGF